MTRVLSLIPVFITVLSTAVSFSARAGTMDPSEGYFCYLPKAEDVRVYRHVSLSAHQPDDTLPRQAMEHLFLSSRISDGYGTCGELDSDGQLACEAGYWTMKVDFSETKTFHDGSYEFPYYEAKYWESTLGVYLSKPKTLYCVQTSWLPNGP